MIGVRGSLDFARGAPLPPRRARDAKGAQGGQGKMGKRLLIENLENPTSQLVENRVFRVLSAAKELSDPSLQPLENTALLTASYSIHETISNAPKSLKTLSAPPF